MRGLAVIAQTLAMIAGNDGVLLVSTNGSSWLSRNSGVYGDGNNLRSITCSNDTWLVVGNGGIILSSTNTLNWTRRASRTLENLHDVQYLNGRFVAIGNRGTILQSGRVIGARLIVHTFDPRIGFEIAIEGETGCSHRLQASTDLRSWTDLLTFSNAQTTTHYLDEEALFYSCRFYRVVSP